MKTIRFLTWFAILTIWAISLTLYPDSAQTVRSISTIIGAIVEIAYRIRRQKAYDTAISPDPIQSLDLTKRS